MQRKSIAALVTIILSTQGCTTLTHIDANPGPGTDRATFTAGNFLLGAAVIPPVIALTGTNLFDDVFDDKSPLETFAISIVAMIVVTLPGIVVDILFGNSPWSQPDPLDPLRH